MRFDAWMQLANAHMAWIEAHRHPILDAVFIFFTVLGTEAFLLFFVALGYWLLDRPVLGRAAGMLIVAGFLNSFLKGAFLEPRPSVSHVLPAEGWSFPSGHAQVAAALWGGLALELRRRGRRWGAAGLWALAAAVALSRPYLGVHYPHDVVFGFVFGAAQVFVFAQLFRLGGDPFARDPHRSGSSLPQARAGWIMTGVLFLALVVLGFHASVQGIGARLAGALVGLGLGLVEARRLGLMAAPPGWRARGVLVLVGVLGLLVAWRGLKLAFGFLGLEEALFANFVRYLAVGLWIGVGAPLVVCRGRL